MVYNSNMEVAMFFSAMNDADLCLIAQNEQSVLSFTLPGVPATENSTKEKGTEKAFVTLLASGCCKGRSFTS